MSGGMDKRVNFCDTVKASGFKKFDGDKPTFEIVCDLMQEIGYLDKVLKYGANKYGRDNWKLGSSELDLIRYKNAAIRHLMVSLTDDQFDDESGLHHMAHAAVNCLFVMYLERNPNNKDATHVFE